MFCTLFLVQNYSLRSDVIFNHNINYFFLIFRPRKFNDDVILEAFGIEDKAVC